MRWLNENMAAMAGHAPYAYDIRMWITAGWCWTIARLSSKIRSRCHMASMTLEPQILGELRDPVLQNVERTRFNGTVLLAMLVPNFSLIGPVPPSERALICRQGRKMENCRIIIEKL
jgi:hypothetical protein